MEANNMTALRKALMELMTFTCNSCERRLCEEDVVEEDGQRSCVPCGAILKARAALSAPVRNCDIGTVEEQLERHRLYCIGFCTTHVCDLKKYDTETCKKCFAKWAQMKGTKYDTHN